MLEEEAGVMRNAMTTRAPCGAKNNDLNQMRFTSWFTNVHFVFSISSIPKI